MRAGELRNLSGVAHLLTKEVERPENGGGYVVVRFLEVLCADAVRSQLEATLSEEVAGFAGSRILLRCMPTLITTLAPQVKLRRT